MPKKFCFQITERRKQQQTEAFFLKHRKENIL